MKKKVIMLLFALIACIATAIPSFAAGNMPRLVDNGNLLEENEESTLLAKLDEVSERQKLDIVVVTVNSLDGKTPMEYADDFYDYNGYGFTAEKDGVLLLVSMEDRDWYISTSGYGITAVTDAGREYMSEKFVGELSDGNYVKAFTIFAGQCDDFITQARTGKAYDKGNLPRGPFPVLNNLLIALVIGFAASFITTGIMRAKLKTVRFQPAAGGYIKENSLNVTESRDLFLYTRLDRRKKPKENSSSGGSRTHTSSSGARHGGGGGKF